MPFAKKIVLFFIAASVFLLPVLARATSTPFNSDVNLKVGIGTTLTSQAGLTVMTGNVGIGTWIPSQMLDVVGTTRTTGLTLTTGAADGYVLVGNSVGVGTWMAAGTLPISGGASAVGGLNAVQYNSPIGTLAGASNIFSFNGTNVGIGTTNGTALLDVRGTVWPFNIDAAGNVGVGTTLTTTSGLTVMNGNVGIGTWKPLSAFNIKTSATGGLFEVAGNGTNGVVIGNRSSGILSLETQANDRMTIDASGNVGIGTTILGNTGVAVMNGNVGIGTWKPNSMLVVKGAFAGAYTAITGDTTLSNTHYLVFVDSTSSAITITLPTAVGIGGRCYQIKDSEGQASVNNITITTTGAETVDGAGSQIMTINYMALNVCSNGANWKIF